MEDMRNERSNNHRYNPYGGKRNKKRIKHGHRHSKMVCKIMDADRHIPITMISAHGFEGRDTYKLREKQYVIMSSVPERRLY